MQLENALEHMCLIVFGKKTHFKLMQFENASPHIVSSVLSAITVFSLRQYENVSDLSSLVFTT